MSETTLVRDPKLVGIVDKLKMGTIETEIGYTQVGLIILLGIFYVAITALGIDKYNKCEGIQGSEKYQNLKNVHESYHDHCHNNPSRTSTHETCKE